MKRNSHSIATIVFLCSFSAFGQAVRIDIPLQTSGPNVPLSGGPLPQTLWVSNASVYVCAHPSATLAACQGSPVTTYTDATKGTSCPSASQMVQLPGNTCTASAGTTANLGFWYAGGIVDYWVVSSYGSFGPFTISPPVGGSGSGSVIASPQFSVHYQPDSGSQAVAQGDPDFTTDGAGDVSLTTLRAGVTDFLPRGRLNLKSSTCSAAGNTKSTNNAGSINSGSNVLNSTSAVFAPGDVGTDIIIANAGTNGTLLLDTKITGYNSATQVTLAANSSATVSGVSFSWGTDDTAAWQRCLTSAYALNMNITCPNGGYLVRQPLNATTKVFGAQLIIFGDGNGANLFPGAGTGCTVIHALTTPGAVFDFGGDWRGGTDNFAVYSAANSDLVSQATTCFIASQGGVANTAGNFFKVSNSTFKCGSTANEVAGMWLAADQGICDNSTLRGTGGGALIGFGLGLATSVSSSNYTLYPPYTYNSTLFTSTGCTYSGQLAPAIQFTGIRQATVNSGAITMESGTTYPHSVEISNDSGGTQQTNSISGFGINQEDSSGNSGDVGWYFMTDSTGNNLGGVLGGASTGQYAIGVSSTGNLHNSTFNLAGCCSVINAVGTVKNVTLNLAGNYTAFGTVSGAGSTNLTISGRQVSTVSPANILADLPAGITGTCIYLEGWPPLCTGTNFYSSTFSGNTLGNVLTNAGIFSGQYINYLPYNNNFTLATNHWGATGGTITQTTGKTDPFGGTSATEFVNASGVAQIQFLNNASLYTSLTSNTAYTVAGFFTGGSGGESMAYGAGSATSQITLSTVYPTWPTTPQCFTFTNSNTFDNVLGLIQLNTGETIYGSYMVVVPGNNCPLAVQYSQAAAQALPPGTLLNLLNGNPLTPSVRAGTWSISSATSVAVTFGTAMSAAPASCALTPGASATTTGSPFATSYATTGFTVNVPISGTLAGTYLCSVNNTN